MSDIEILYPKIDINLLEIEEYLPSFKLSLFHSIEGGKYNYKYYCEFWIEVKSWDIFVNSFNKDKALLKDMDDEERISIDNDSLTLNFSQKKCDLIINSICKFTLSKDEKEYIIRKCLSFPKYWDKL